MLVVEDGVQPTCGRCLKKLKEIADRKADYERQQAEADAYTAELKAEFEEALVSLIEGKDAEISGGFNLHWHGDSVIVTGPENYFDGNNRMEFATPTEAILRLADDACIEIGAQQHT